MTPEDNNSKFNEFRERFPYFIYESCEYSVAENSLDIRFKFDLGGKYLFNPSIRIPLSDFYDLKNVPDAALENIIFHIGMVELISYWKAACPPIVIIKPFRLDEAQVRWWKNLYFNGLGEFFYLNGIAADIETFVNISSESEKRLLKFEMPLDESYIVPVGGGKDSVVTLELLKNKYSVTPLVINPRKATSECIQAAGFSKNDCIEIFRTIDPLLLELNAQGFLNGHTPFSALLAFVSLLTGVLSKKRNIALSNECSANETTVIGQNINHQYSKSYEFEKDFREYVSMYINEGLNYFSFLRPLHEIQIAYLFSMFPQYFQVFKSCNAGSKTDIWCCNCPKCLFSFIILSPFISPDDLIIIFGENLLDKQSLLPVFNQLIGVGDVKPFDCIGTIEEVKNALFMSMEKYTNRLPFLLKEFAENTICEKSQDLSLGKWMNVFDNKNFLNDCDLQIIKIALSC